MKKVSIIIPAYNEEKTIRNTLNSYLEFFKDLKNQGILDFEIIIVINNTIDKTEEIVKEFSEKHKEIKYLNFERGGKGFAIIEGFKISLLEENDLIGFVDADMATSPKAFYSLIENIRNYDGIIASRHLKKSIITTQQPISRRIAGRVFNYLVRFLFLVHYKDTQCGAKIFKKNAIQVIILEVGETEWILDVDLLYIAKKNKLKVKEYPTVWDEPGDSKIDLKRTGLQMFFAIVQLRILKSRFKRLLKLIKPVTRFFYRTSK
tara:strand:+ start:4278 stop:5063 length:786 start_codon:yes stop_codon:yes gene_type:complete